MMRITNAHQIVANMQRPGRNVQGRTNANEINRDSYTPSEAARDFTTVRRALADCPDIRENKVADIASRIKNGTYSVSAEDVAAKILGNLR
jgi:flagellar biosynthesis anti-sigma factor FlgM